MMEQQPMIDSQHQNSLSKFQNRTIRRDDPEYGHPVKGSLTEKRGLQAQQHILEEVRYLCNIIKENGEQQHDGTVHIKFEKLFDIYTNISNKLVGILLRARKYGYVTFPGEILFQHKDDHVIIKLIHQS